MYWGASGRPEFACEPPTKRSATRLPISLGEVPAGHLLRILSWPRHDGARTIPATIDRSASLRKFHIFELLLVGVSSETHFQTKLQRRVLNRRSRTSRRCTSSHGSLRRQEHDENSNVVGYSACFF